MKKKKNEDVVPLVRSVESEGGYRYKMDEKKKKKMTFLLFLVFFYPVVEVFSSFFF